MNHSYAPPPISPFFWSSFSISWLLSFKLFPCFEIIKQNVPKQNASNKNCNDYWVRRLVYLPETKISGVLKHTDFLFEVSKPSDIYCRPLSRRIFHLPCTCRQKVAHICAACISSWQQERSRIVLFFIVLFLLFTRPSMCCFHLALRSIPKTLCMRQRHVFKIEGYSRRRRRC